MPKKAATKLSRWLASIYACPLAQHQFRKVRTFDAAWKLLDDWHWVWWLGWSVIQLKASWDTGYGYNTSDMKRHIYKRVKAKYLKFKG